MTLLPGAVRPQRADDPRGGAVGGVPTQQRRLVGVRPRHRRGLRHQWLGQSDTARRVIDTSVYPRLLSHMASCDKSS